MLLLGPRRVGKTVLIKEICAQYTNNHLLLNGEDLNTTNLLAERTVLNYKKIIGNNQLIAIDEA